MTPVRLLCVLGYAGLRMDFVAGWLGTLPNFIKSDWHLDPVTRQSRAVTSNAIDLQEEFDLRDYISNSCSLSLTPDAITYYATKAHRINMCHMPHVTSGAIKVCKVVPDKNTNEIQVQWEFFLKTFGKLEYDGSWNIDRLISKQDITNEDRIQKLHQLLVNCHRHNIYHTDHRDINFPELHYSRLHAPGGSLYLCEILDIKVDDDYHKFWDVMVPLSQTPSTVTLWGQQWHLKDYAN